jgi:adenylate kinase
MTLSIVFIKKRYGVSKQARVYMDAGDLVPTNWQLKCLLMRINTRIQTGFYIDGYPTISQWSFRWILTSIDPKVAATIALEADEIQNVC